MRFRAVMVKDDLASHIHGDSDAEIPSWASMNVFSMVQSWAVLVSLPSPEFEECSVFGWQADPTIAPRSGAVEPRDRCVLEVVGQGASSWPGLLC
jgi:hypothetical protein